MCGLTGHPTLEGVAALQHTENLNALNTLLLLLVPCLQSHMILKHLGEYFTA